eukprot:gnl/TRDRNA2_/TRDRNA2_172670_c1_seq10.p2 gnl/TRDRNA2_/TRDRNA2_172670_c1~~gnl/TRDRNA2_/TRDRNA2_172670_c1_seq10.p2  ORF type:complete len:111 (+),score=3.74 gnl/TRDRNA2_/TRDRNA2_172670_c1_seq10:580-912(+)
MEKWVKQFLPNCEIHLLKDGNHLGLMSHSLATEDLPNTTTPKQLRAEIVEQIAVFLGWPSNITSHNVTPNVTGKSAGAHSLHNVTPKESRAKIALQRHAKDRHTRSRLQH